MKRIQRIIAALLCCCLLFGCSGAPASSVAADSSSGTAQAETEAGPVSFPLSETAEFNIGTIVMDGAPSNAECKFWLKREEETGSPAAAMELPDGRIVTGKTSELLGASSALLLNALKELAGIEHDKHVISPEALKPIQALKTEYLGSKNPRLHSDETLIALSISAADNEDAKLALQQIPKLKGCQVHTSVLLSQVDILEFRKLGVELTCEPKSEHAKKLQK